MNKKSLLIFKHIFASFLYLELDNLTFIRVAKNFQTDLILTNNNFELFLFNKNILESYLHIF